MKYSEEFIEYIDTCKKHNQFIGIGNPAAPLLIICNDIKTELLTVNENWYYKNYEFWLENIRLRKTRQEIGLELFSAQNSLLYKKQHSWNTYQNFHDCLFKDDLTTLTNEDITLWLNKYIDDKISEDLFLEFIQGEKSLKPTNEHRIDFLERTFIIELPERQIQNVIFKTEFIKEFAFILLDGNLLNKKEIEKSFDQVGWCKLPGFLYNVAKNVSLYEPNKIFIIEDWGHLTKKDTQFLALLIRFFWYKEIPVIDGKQTGRKFIRRKGFKTPDGNTIPATTRLNMNFEGFAKYKQR